MKLRKSIITFSVIIVILAALSAVTLKATHAQSENLDPALSSKLDQVLANQRSIMAELSAMKEQLRILTIRVTQTQ
jgi:hypothetical protein